MSSHVGRYPRAPPLSSFLSALKSAVSVLFFRCHALNPSVEPLQQLIVVLKLPPCEANVVHGFVREPDRQMAIHQGEVLAPVDLGAGFKVRAVQGHPALWIQRIQHAKKSNPVTELLNPNVLRLDHVIEPR